MNAVFAPDREHAGDRKPQPFSQADEQKGTLALQPFQLQYISSAPDRGPSIVTELEIQASDVGRNRHRCEDRNAAPNDRIAHPRQ